ncbi:MAG: HD domain-containing phosphohydrolase [Candidatus Hydrogenedentales bacterium]
MDEKVLFVDDDANILEAYQRKLQQVLPVYTAQGPHLGLREIQENGPFAVVVSDMNMPMMNGVEFLQKVRELAPDTVRIMLTGKADIKVAMEAVNDGNVFRFLTKPCPSRLMGDSLLAAIKQYRLVVSEKVLLEGTLKGTTELLTEILSWVCPNAFGHSLQLRNTVKALASKLTAGDEWQIEVAATLSQIGVLALPSEILSKLGDGEPLTSEEEESLKTVPAVGHELLRRIPRLEEVAEIILYAHKHYDGSGFPGDAISGKSIPLGSRILKAVEDFHGLRAIGRSREDAINEMMGREGWYDLSVLSALSTCTLATMGSEAPLSRVVPISLNDLKPGLTLASPIMTVEGQKVLGAGTEISEALLIRLHKYAESAGVKEPIEVVVNS